MGAAGACMASGLRIRVGIRVRDRNWEKPLRLGSVSHEVRVRVMFALNGVGDWKDLNWAYPTPDSNPNHNCSHH